MIEFPSPHTGELRVAHDAGYVLVDEWLRIRAPAQSAVLVKGVRGAWAHLLERKHRQPDLDLSAAGGAIVQSIVDLLNHEEAVQQWNLR